MTPVFPQYINTSTTQLLKLLFLDCSLSAECLHWIELLITFFIAPKIFWNEKFFKKGVFHDYKIDFIHASMTGFTVFCFYVSISQCNKIKRGSCINFKIPLVSLIVFWLLATLLIRVLFWIHYELSGFFLLILEVLWLCSFFSHQLWEVWKEFPHLDYLDPCASVIHSMWKNSVDGTFWLIPCVCWAAFCVRQSSSPCYPSQTPTVGQSWADLIPDNVKDKQIQTPSYNSMYKKKTVYECLYPERAQSCKHVCSL